MSFAKLLLIIPPQHFVMEGFRTALVALAGYVNRRIPQIEIILLDLSTTPQTMVRQKLDHVMGRGGHGRVLAGISTVTADYQSALVVARELKSIDPDIVVVFGGHHASGDAEVVLRNHPGRIDFVVSGEGEISLTRLLSNFPAVENVPGIAFMRGGDFVKNAAAALLDTEDLDHVPLTFDGCEIAVAPGKFDHVTYVSARGCPLSCDFCAVSNQSIRTKSVLQVMRDVRELVARGYSRIAFEDNFFAHNKRRTREVCAGLAELQAEGVAFTWDCQTRVESMDREEIVGLMERSGCEAVYLGVEALNEKALNFLGKTQDSKTYLSRLFDRVAPRILASNMSLYLNLQFGLPVEDDVQIGQTITAMERLGEIAGVYGRTITVFPQLFVVYPGTEHFRSYVAMGNFPHDVFESFTAWEAEQKPVLTWLGETFAHGVGGLPLGILDRHGLVKGRYAVDESAVSRVAETIDRIDRLSGVKVFRYGEHLVKETFDGGSQSGKRQDGQSKSRVTSGSIGAGSRRKRSRSDLGRPNAERRAYALHDRRRHLDDSPRSGRDSE